MNNRDPSHLEQLNQFQFIIQIMSTRNNRASFSSYTSHLYSKVNIFQNQFPRHSFCFNSATPPIFTEGRTGCQKRLSMANGESPEKMMGISKNQACLFQKSKPAKLKQSLNALQKKIKDAKKQLKRWPDVLDNHESQQETDRKPSDLRNSDTKEEILTTVQSSVDKLSFTPTQANFNFPPQIKTYYLSHLQLAIEGKNLTALNHLKLSLKVLQNQHKIQTPTFSQLQKHKVSFNKQKCDMHKKTLLLDIDQTLLHCYYDDTKPFDIVLPIKVEDGTKSPAYISIRPYAISFLKKMSKLFEIIAFTAAHQDYADAVLDQIDPQKAYIKHRLYRRNCFQIYENIFAKDLRIVNRDLSNLILVDNSPFSYIYQLENGIPILPYYGGEDNQLIQLQKYLELVAKCGDVRELNKQTFKLHHYSVFTDVEELVRTLYLG